MSYNRIGLPRAFVDLISYNLAHGWSDESNISLLQDDDSTPVTFDSGSKIEMFDNRPSNHVTIEKENQEFYIQYDTEFATDTLAESSFLAILNHNFNTADVVFTVQISDNSTMSGATTVSTTGNHTKVINAEANDSAGEIDPAGNGWTLITWDTQTSNNRYVRITFADENGSAQNFDADVKIGSILYGEYIDFPHSPDMNVSTSINYGGTELQESIGGGTFANTTHFGQPAWAVTPPWEVASTTSDRSHYSFRRRYGRRSHSMKFSYLSDTNLFSEDIHSEEADEWFDSDALDSSFYQRILGQHLPFLFTIDGTSTTEGDYGLFRLANDGFKSTQVASRMWDIDLNLTESW